MKKKLFAIILVSFLVLPALALPVIILAQCPAGCTYVNGVCGPRESLYATCHTTCGSDPECHGLRHDAQYPVQIAGGQCRYDCQFYPAGTAPTELPIIITGAGEVILMIENVANWLFAILLAVALIFILYSAFLFMTAAGDPSRVTSARQTLVYALIGVAIAFLTRGLIVILKSIIGA